MGGIDLVLDDGSHIASHQKASFDALFPLLADGGIYMIEDVHTAYWRETYDGGYKRTGTAIEVAKDWVDDIHRWYHERGASNDVARQIKAVHFHDSIIVIEKGQVFPPQHTQTGRNAGDLPIH